MRKEKEKIGSNAQNLRKLEPQPEQTFLVKKKCRCSAAICQIGPRFVKIGPTRIKSGPRGASNPDLSSEIRLLLDFYEYSRLFKPYGTSIVSLSVCKKRPFSVFFLQFFSQIRTLKCKSRPFPNQVLKKRPHPDKSPEKTDQMGAL